MKIIPNNLLKIQILNDNYFLIKRKNRKEL